MKSVHIWKRKKEINKEEFHKIAKEFRRIEKEIKKEGITLTDGFGEGVGAIITVDMIWFNGSKEKNESYETVYFPPIIDDKTEQVLKEREGFYTQSCKTNNYPYDIAVKSILIIIKEHLKEAFHVYYEGEEKEWDLAKGLCQKTLGYGLEFKIELI